MTSQRVTLPPWLLASGDDPLVQLISLEGEPRVHREIRIPARGSRCGEFSPDSRWFAIGTEDGLVQVRSVTSTESLPPIEFRGLTAGVADIQFSADVRTLHARSRDTRTRRWAFNGNHAGAIPVTSDADVEPISSIAVSPEGRWLAVAGTRGHLPSVNAPVGTIRIFDTRDGLREYRIPGHRANTSAAFSPDGKWLATTGRDSFVRVWAFPELAAALAAGSALPEPRILAPDNPTRDIGSRHIAIHPRGTLYATCGDGFLFEWDLNEAKPVCQHSHIHSIMYLLPAIAISPDGKWLAVARFGYDSEPKAGWTQYGAMILVFDCSKPGDLVPHLELPAPITHVASISFSPDSRHLIASARAGKGPAIWDLDAPEIAASAISGPAHSGSTVAVMFPALESGASRLPWAALGCDDGRLLLWDWKRGTDAVIRIETGSSLYTFASLPGGRLVTGGLDGRIRIWETNVDRLLEFARASAGRELSESERARFER
jgi:WD40 repeat protein